VSLKRVYRKIWAIVISGVALFFAILALGGLPEGKPSLDIRSPYALLLLLPIALCAWAVRTTALKWRCEHCGALLPTRMATHCRKCGQPIDLS